MADYVNSNLIVNITPYRFQTGVATSAVINVEFARDMQRSSFTDATISLQVSGTVLRVPVTYSYANRILTITPVSGLNPNTSYTVTLIGDSNPTNDALTNKITGILDVAGNGFVGQYNWVFQTSSVGVPVAPVLLSPANENAINQQPTFTWTPVAGADHYEIQVSNNNTFETLYYPLQGDSYSQTMTTLTPARSFTYDMEYWWRVRAIAVDSNNNEISGQWSQVGSFYYGDPTYGTVTPDDAPLGVIAPTQAVPTVTAAYPAPGTSNLQKYPDRITAVVSGKINLANINDHSFTITGSAVDGHWTPNAFAPTFTPALNGDMYGSGGIIIAGPADGFQQIRESGKAEAEPSAEYNGTNTVLTLGLPDNYWQDNNWYKVVLDLPELAAPVEWDFTSNWKPVFTSSHSVRQITDFFVPELTDDDLWFVIRRNSLYAIFIQVYMPTKVDANFQIYQPPVSFDVNNPPFYAREYVRIKSGLDLLKAKYYQLLAKPQTTLADFSVNPNTAALKENIAQAISEIKLELKEFEDSLRGHSNRGYARGREAQRGSYGSGQIDTFDFPWTTHGRGGRRWHRGF